MGRRGTECATDTGAAWRRFRVASALCAALLWAPAAAAADLLISDLSDGIYDPSPVGGQVTYHVSLENGDVDTATDVVAIFDLPAGATAVALPGFCTAAAESSSWDTEEAPIKAEVIPGWRSTQAIAS